MKNKRREEPDMNSILRRASGKDMTLRPRRQSLLTRGTWKNLLALAVVALLSAVSAFANDSKQIGIQGINGPRGMILAHIPNPAVAGGVIQDYWVTDSVLGFCRLDNGILNAGTCDPNGTFEPSDYQAETRGINGSNGYVFVASIDGVRRINFIANATNTHTIIDTAHTQVFGGAGSLFTNNVAVTGRNLPDTASLGPDGKLYMMFVGNIDIWRVLNPLSPTFTPAGNKVERVGTTEGTGGRGTSMAWIGHDLWLDDVGFINRIQNADQCFYTFPKCQAVIQFNNLLSEAGMASDQFISSIPNGRYLYFGNGSRVVRYDTQTPALMEVWNQQGTLQATGTLQHYSFITGLNFVQTLTPTPLNPTATDPGPAFIEEMLVVMDPFVNALFPPATLTPPRNGAGITWSLAASPTLVPESVCDGASTTATIQNPPGCAISSIGSPGQITSPNPIGAKRGVLLSSGITHPRGLLWLRSNWWVSDEALGFCRIDQNPVTGIGSLSHCFQPNAAFFPGQPAAAQPDGAGRQVVYVPDASGSPNIYRFLFTPDATGGNLNLTGILNGASRGTFIETVALPTGPFNDGALYIGYSDSGLLAKITNPATAPSAATTIARLFNGIGVISMAFNGNDLYLSELGPPQIAGQFIKKGVVTVLTRASPSMSEGSASPVKRAIARLQAPQIIAENPGGFTVGPTGSRPSCLPPAGVKLSSSVPADPATTPAFYIGTLGLTADGVTPDGGVTGGLGELPEVDQYDFICNAQIVWVTDGAIDPLLSSSSPLGAVTAMAFSSLTDPTAIMAIGDDPSVIIPTQTRQRGTIRKNGPPGTGSTGQGHVYLVF
jgi:hypothetical protein